MSGYTSIVDASPGFVPGTFDAQDVRLAAAGNTLPGVFESGDYAVSQRGAGANMSVDIAAGRAYVLPADAARQGAYTPWMGSTYNTSSDGGYTWTAADGANPRIDLVCIDLRDTDFSGAYTGYKFRIVDGTPNASATHPLETAYWPAVPAGCVPLAACRIAAAGTTITDANIYTLNAMGGTGRPSYSVAASAETTTSASYTRLTTNNAAAVYVPHANARVRVSYKAHWKISVASGTQGVALFINGNQLKASTVGAVPGVSELTLTLGTLYSHLSTAMNLCSLAAPTTFSSYAGATLDVSDVATGQLLGAYNNGTTLIPGSVDVFGLPAGWYIIEPRFKTSANTLTVKSRYLWAEVVC